MKPQKYLSWENFLASVVVAGEQRIHRISNSPLIEIFWDGSMKTIGLSIQSTESPEIPDPAKQLASISTEVIRRHGVWVLQIKSTSPSINREFYIFANAIADRILETGHPANQAIAYELACFSALLEQKQILSVERQHGLLGELIVLERIISAEGPDGLEAWIGPKGEPHDFRITTNEIEVKTSASSRRVHTISSLTQMIQSPGSSLFVMSILLGAAGRNSGFSLAGKIESISNSLARYPNRHTQFRQALESAGYAQADHNHYVQRFGLRRPIAVVPVDAHFPSITASSISILLGKEAYRIDRLSYDINMEGLESEEGTTLYQSVFPYVAVI